MKSYDELTDNLLERRDTYVAEQRRKRKTRKLQVQVGHPHE